MTGSDAGQLLMLNVREQTNRLSTATLPTDDQLVPRLVYVNGESDLFNFCIRSITFGLYDLKREPFDGRCPEMPSEVERVCCGESRRCITEYPVSVSCIVICCAACAF